MKHVKLFEQFINEADDEDYLKTLANSDYFAKGYETLFGLQSSIKRILGDREISPDESDVLDAINWLKDGLGNGDPRKTSLGKKLLKMKWVTESEVNEGITESYYTAIADLGGKKTKENLDSFEEVQDFMDKMIKKHAISVEVIKFSQEGKSQTLKYDWDGEKWLKTSK